MRILFSLFLFQSYLLAQDHQLKDRDFYLNKYDKIHSKQYKEYKKLLSKHSKKEKILETLIRLSKFETLIQQEIKRRECKNVKEYISSYEKERILLKKNTKNYYKEYKAVNRIKEHCLESIENISKLYNDYDSTPSKSLEEFIHFLSQSKSINKIFLKKQNLRELEKSLTTDFFYNKKIKFEDSEDKYKDVNGIIKTTYDIDNITWFNQEELKLIESLTQSIKTNQKIHDKELKKLNERLEFRTLSINLLLSNTEGPEVNICKNLNKKLISLKKLNKDINNSVKLITHVNGQCSDISNNHYKLEKHIDSSSREKDKKIFKKNYSNKSHYNETSKK
ncbi:MAG: hypothetical protein N4A33_10740 [Bacteriovoracaceae bacterium]|jgi:hypothetical protein|nr:hypothetical protein [Bacteriovoracaceae bacterium]